MDLAHLPEYRITPVAPLTVEALSQERARLMGELYAAFARMSGFGSWGVLDDYEKKAIIADASAACNLLDNQPRHWQSQKAHPNSEIADLIARQHAIALRIRDVGI